MAQDRTRTMAAHPARLVVLVGSVLAGGLLLAGCGIPPEMGQTDRPPNFFVADELVVTRDLAFMSGSAALTPTAAAQLDQFLRELVPSARDRITVIGHGPLGLSRAGGVARELRAVGLSQAEVAEVAGSADHVTVAVARTVHLPTACLTESYLRPVTGFPYLPPASCANEYNLARMIADPADLTRGRSPGPAAGGVAAEAVRRYRDGEVIAPPTEGSGGE